MKHTVFLFSYFAAQTDEVQSPNNNFIILAYLLRTFLGFLKRDCHGLTFFFFFFFFCTFPCARQKIPIQLRTRQYGEQAIRKYPTYCQVTMGQWQHVRRYIYEYRVVGHRQMSTAKICVLAFFVGQLNDSTFVCLLTTDF